MIVAIGVEVGVQMWKVVPEGRVWVLWFRFRFRSGVGVVGMGGCEGCLR